MKRFPPPYLQNEVIAGIRLAAMASAPFWARCHARDALGKWRVPAEMIETAELLVSELVTNAAKFAGPLPDRLHTPDLASIGIIDVMLRYLPARLVIEVSDSDANPPAAADPGPDAEGGRGLMLVQALSAEWSYYLRPSGGKTVYCVVRLSQGGRSLAPATGPA